MQTLRWLWPLPDGKAASVSVTDPESPGAFGYGKRKHSVHTGVDLHAPIGSRVVAVEAGRVVAVIPFTGPRADSSFYHETFAVLVEGLTGVVVYGEIDPCVAVGDAVEAGQTVGAVMEVLKGDKGNGTSMLHLELYAHGTIDVVWWYHGTPRPERLLDPTPYLLPLVA